MILAKACHDFDIISWNLADPVVSLQSFGSLLHFRCRKRTDWSASPLH